METISVNGIKIHPDIVRNLSRILSERIFKYKNINPIVTVNSYTHVYISFIDISDPNYAIPVCRINLFVNSYSITGSIVSGPTYISAKGFVRDRYKVYKSLKYIMKDYRNRGQ